MAQPVTATVGVFGGSGFYSFLDDVEHVEVDTPYGPTSAPVAVGSVGDRRVAFLPRHGVDHTLPPHKVPFRANLWALRSLGVTRVLGPCAVGSLQSHLRPGHVVVLDQLVDRTNGRSPDTYFDGPVVGHLTFADPYCPQLRAVSVDASRAAGATTHDAGTCVVIQGPRFSTRAESRWFTQMGWDVVNMTQHPEAALARELGLCYAGIALVTDHDAGLDGVDGIEPVTMARVFEVLRENVELTKDLLARAIPSIPEDRSCGCGNVPAPIP